MNRILFIFILTATIMDHLINSSVNGVSNNNVNDEAEHKSTNTFQQRLKMLPIKVFLQVMKTKNALSNGMSKTMQLNSTHRMMEGVQESSGALFGLVKDGIGDLHTLVFGN
nr:uncharacterized protein LOC117992842 [Maniola hyperantus]